MTAFTESVVEQSALGWPEGVTWQARKGADIGRHETGRKPGGKPGDRPRAWSGQRRDRTRA